MLKEKNQEKLLRKQQKKIIDYVKTNPETNLSKVLKELKLTVSSKTRNRRLAEEGIKHYI